MVEIEYAESGDSSGNGYGDGSYGGIVNYIDGWSRGYGTSNRDGYGNGYGDYGASAEYGYATFGYRNDLASSDSLIEPYYGEDSCYWAQVAAGLTTHLDGVAALWRSSNTGYPANGGSENFKAAPGLYQQTSGPLQLCKAGTFHATWNPRSWKGGRLWIVKLHGEIAVDGNKIGALKRTIIKEIINPFD